MASPEDLYGRRRSRQYYRLKRVELFETAMALAPARFHHGSGIGGSSSNVGNKQDLLRGRDENQISGRPPVVF